MKLLQVKPKNPVTMYAIQYDGKNLEELQEWVKNFEPNFTTVEIDCDPHFPNPDLVLTDINKDEYDIFVCDWLVVEVYPNKSLKWLVMSNVEFNREMEVVK